MRVGIASALKGNLIVGARGNPYDVHTRYELLEQAMILI